MKPSYCKNISKTSLIVGDNQAVHIRHWEQLKVSRILIGQFHEVRAADWPMTVRGQIDKKFPNNHYPDTFLLRENSQKHWRWSEIVLRLIILFPPAFRKNCV